METTTFGGTAEEADALLDLVLAGTKRGTCWAARFGQLSYLGKQVAFCDSEGCPRVVVETTAIERRRFSEVDEAWAQIEGEGDGTLAHWRAVHEAFFRNEGYFAEDMELWCEQFRVVERLPSGA